MSPAILVVRLGAMGDIIHALPAVASLRRSFPDHRLHWCVAPKWMPLLTGNPSVDEVIPFTRSSFGELKVVFKQLRRLRPERAIDFQGLIQSAIAGRASRPQSFFGFDRHSAREPLAALFYTKKVRTTSVHVIDKNLDLAHAAGASSFTSEAFIPQGRDEGELPTGPFVLTSPFAGWMGKQWPLKNYELLALRLRAEGLQLVADIPLQRAAEVAGLKHVSVHTSSLAGLIAATRRAAAVVGLDSGPLHLAAALRKPGVALFGPTDPARNGPYGGTIEVLRSQGIKTSYRRDHEIHPGMRAIGIDAVFEALLQSMSKRNAPLEPRS